MRRAALEAGYRHIDTATMYRNEAQVGRALRDSGVRATRCSSTTKLPPSDAGRERETIDASLEALGLDHVDLWLIHWPPRRRARPDVWQRFVEIADAGLDARDRRQQLRRGPDRRAHRGDGRRARRQSDPVDARALRRRRSPRASASAA